MAAENIRDVRWWSPEDLSDPTVTFAPRALPALLNRLTHDGVPDSPIELTGF